MPIRACTRTKLPCAGVFCSIRARRLPRITTTTECADTIAGQHYVVHIPTFSGPQCSIGIQTDIMCLIPNLHTRVHMYILGLINHPFLTRVHSPGHNGPLLARQWTYCRHTGNLPYIHIMLTIILERCRSIFARPSIHALDPFGALRCGRSWFYPHGLHVEPTSAHTPESVVRVNTPSSCLVRICGYLQPEIIYDIKTPTAF